MGDLSNLNITWRSAVFAMLMFPAVLCCIALLYRHIERRSVFFLVAFILAVVVSNIPYLIGFSGAYTVWPGLTFLPVQIPLVFGPLLYLHAHRLMSEEPFGWRLTLLIPGLISWIYQCWAFFMLGDYQAKWDFTRKFHDPYIVPLETLISILLFIVSAILIIKLHASYKHWLASHRSDDIEFDPIWLKRFLFFLCLGGIVWVALRLADMVFGLSYVNEFWPLAFCQFLVLVLAIEALSRLQTDYPKLPLHTDLLSATDDLQEKRSERDWQTESQAIKSAVMAKNWHLETGFSLQELSKRYGMNQTYVSRALNQGLSQNFSEFINTLRIEHAKHLLHDSDLKVLDIAVSSGFGSKASFNRLFKKYLGITPTQFKAKKVS